MVKNKSATLTLLILCLLKASGAAAVDGDVSYTAPYLWVDPETGQVSTVNPGPEPKVHTETSGSNQTRTGEHEPPAEKTGPNTRLEKTAD